jgi:hypothetical protein
MSQLYNSFNVYINTSQLLIPIVNATKKVGGLSYLITLNNFFENNPSNWGMSLSMVFFNKILPSGDPTQGHLTLTCKIWGFFDHPIHHIMTLLNLGLVAIMIT